MKYICKNVFELGKIAKCILSDYKERRIFALYGGMGVGKTTFVKELVKELGSDNVVNSPTFTIINIYKYNHGEIYHIDLYRIEKEKELEEIGIEEYLYSGNYCFIEWPNIVEHFFDERVLKIDIIQNDNGEREIYVCE